MGREHYEHKSASRTNPPTQETERFMDDEDRNPEHFSPSLRDSIEPRLAWTRNRPETPQRSAGPLYIQEFIQPAEFIKQLEKTDENGDSLGLFSDLPDEARYEWYQHTSSWVNRLIQGDSAQIMASLAVKEGMEGKVQMVYFDPPYGISFNSNMQVDATSRESKSAMCPQEPEMVRMFRDTYKRGIHDYLDVIRENLALARSLLTDSGSLFLQIGGKNVHRLAIVLDEIFGSENRMAMITFVKTGTSTSAGLPEICDYLLWYCRDKSKVKYNQLYAVEDRVDKIKSMTSYCRLELADGTVVFPTKEQRANPDNQALVPPSARFFQRMLLTSQHESKNERGKPFLYQSEEFVPRKGRQWTVSQEGLANLASLKRLDRGDDQYSLCWKRYENEYPGRKLHNNWWELNRPTDLHYVVETAEKVIERCVLMTTEPGDLVLDITCGSGTTALVAERWGRRWITTDASRIPIALARQRLLSAVHKWFVIANSKEGVDLESNYHNETKSGGIDNAVDPAAGFVYNRVPYVSAASLAYDKQKTFTYLVDRPHIERGKKRISSPFTVESHSPYQTLSELEYAKPKTHDNQRVEDNVLKAIMQSGIRLRSKSVIERVQNIERISRDNTNCNLTHFAHGEVHRPDTKTEHQKIVFSILPEDVTCSRGWISRALTQAADLRDIDLLIVVAFNFDPDAFQDVLKLGRVTVHCVRANRDLMIDELSHTKADQAFIEIGEPDIEIHPEGKGEISIEVLGYDTFNPREGNIDHGGEKDIQCWMVDTAYNEKEFSARRFHFPGKENDNQIKRMYRELKKRIDPEEWDTLFKLRSSPFPIPDSGMIAVRIITNTGVEMSTVKSVGD